jgi:hypothetical protein
LPISDLYLVIAAEGDEHFFKTLFLWPVAWWTGRYTVVFYVNFTIECNCFSPWPALVFEIAVTLTPPPLSVS